MAYYIKDKKISEVCMTNEGIKIIRDFIFKKNGYYPIVENRENGNSDIILIQLYCHSSTDGINFTLSKTNLTNTVGISSQEIYVNPIDDKDRNNYTLELKEFIETIPSLIIQNKRNKKIKNLGIK